MSSARYDLEFLQAACEEVEAYLLSKQLFWPINASSPLGEPAFPLLTLGGLLLSIKKSQARELNPGQSAIFIKTDKSIEMVKSRWRVAWGHKAQREFLSRLRQWENYMDELRQDPEIHGDYYAQEIRTRAILDFLMPEMDPPVGAYLDLLTGLDRVLREVLKPTNFIWPTDLVAGFPKESYWYLWGLPNQ